MDRSEFYVKLAAALARVLAGSGLRVSRVMDAVRPVIDEAFFGFPPAPDFQDAQRAEFYTGSTFLLADAGLREKVLFLDIRDFVIRELDRGVAVEPDTVALWAARFEVASSLVERALHEAQVLRGAK